MANPNIRQLVTMTGNTAVMNATTEFANLVSNAADSNSIYRIITLSASNLDIAASQNVSVDLLRSSASYSFIRGATIPAGASLVAVSKDSSLYLVEGDVLQCKAGTNSNVQIICSYEVLS
jgi:hypothetical protein